MKKVDLDEIKCEYCNDVCDRIDKSATAYICSNCIAQMALQVDKPKEEKK